jgi:sec-independent protein translocase protein TatA
VWSRHRPEASCSTSHQIQIVIVLAIALLVFGPKRLPEMGRSIGRGIRDFKDGLTNDTRDETAAEPADDASSRS